MPVDYRPLLILLLALAAPLVLLLGQRWKSAICLIVFELALLGSYLYVMYVPGWKLQSLANTGDARAQFELSRWHANKRVFGQGSADLDQSFFWITKAANQEYPPAMYTLGVMYKYGRFVPRPPDWKGPGGNVFPQPERGQALIDEAVRRGYRPRTKEDLFYDTVYRVPERQLSATGELR